jgi:hypothetical protein
MSDELQFVVPLEVEEFNPDFRETEVRQTLLDLVEEYDVFCARGKAFSVHENSMPLV